MKIIEGAHCMSHGEFCKRIGIIVTVTEVEQITGVKPFAKVKSSLYWNDRDYQHICQGFANHFTRHKNNAWTSQAVRRECPSVRNGEFV